MADKTATLNEVREFFGIELKDFRRLWGELTSEDKTQLRRGIGDGTLTY